MLHNFPLKCAHLWVSPPSPTSHRHRWLPQIALMHRSTHHWGSTRMSCRLIIRQNYDYADNYDARSAPLCVLSTIIIIIICVLPQTDRQTDRRNRHRMYYYHGEWMDGMNGPSSSLLLLLCYWTHLLNLRGYRVLNRETNMTMLTISHSPAHTMSYCHPHHQPPTQTPVAVNTAFIVQQQQRSTTFVIIIIITIINLTVMAIRFKHIICNNKKSRASSSSTVDGGGRRNNHAHTPR